MFGASRKCSSNDNKHILKFFTEGNFSSSNEQNTWLHLNIPFGKFHLDIYNKMADDNGTAHPHEIDFDISKDHFCWIDIFIKWFEDYKLLYQFVRLLLKVEICPAFSGIIWRRDFLCFIRRIPLYFL